MRVQLFAVLLVAAGCSLGPAMPPATARAQHAQKIICSNCGFQNLGTMKFCTHCGAALPARQQQATTPPATYPRAQAKAAASKTETGSTPTPAPTARRKSLPPPRQAITRAAVLPMPATLRVGGAAPTAQGSRKQTRRRQTSLRLKQAFSRPVRLPRLFNIPTADVIGSLDLFFNGGGSFGIEKERTFLGQAGLGLGQIAQVEFSTQSVINSLQQGTASIPTSAFKMRVVQERGNLPALAVALRGTTRWHNLFGLSPEVSFQTRLTKLYIVASKKYRKIRAHFGVALTDVRVRNPFGWTFKRPELQEMQRNIWAPFGGISIRANPKAQVMMEIEGLPSYRFETGGVYSDRDIGTIWAGVAGIRFYFLNWLIADAGVRYRSDFDGIADATIQANINMLLPFSRLSEKPQGAPSPR